MKATKNVLEACAATPSVRHCLLTSSLLACVWQDNSASNGSITIDHKSWSDESVCINKKVRKKNIISAISLHESKSPKQCRFKISHKYNVCFLTLNC